MRKAQWRWDFAVASHGASFHAPQEIQRILAHGINKVHEAKQTLCNVFYDLQIFREYECPQFTSKEEAQRLIGFDLAQIKADKEDFLLNVVPNWIEKT
ncbi:MAG: ammonia-forming cytochrome c nitrite reductase subunit c552 [Mangrovibacterium sp.]